MAKKLEEEIIKSNRYCIEKIFVKSMKRNEIRFAVYKDTVRGDDIYFPRSLDVTELS